MRKFVCLGLGIFSVFAIPVVIAEGISPTVLIPCSITDMGEPGPKYFNVSISSNAKESVLTIRTQDGIAIINPPPYQYAGLALSEMTKDDALIRFGIARHHQDFSTFDLWSNRTEVNLFHLDLRFDKKRGKVFEYRVRGIGISKPIWTKVGGVG